jgi:KDO2-lipid IV(A) lauroyltransferase
MRRTDRMAKPRNDLVDRIQYIGLRIVAMFLHCWPVNAALGAARALGDLVCAIDRKHRNRAIANLSRSFPELAPHQARLLARRSMQNLFMFFAEVLFTTRLIRIDTWPRYVRLENFRPVLELLLRRRRPLIMLTGHYGNFEISNYVLSTFGFDTVAIGRPLDNPYVDRWLTRMRQRQGARIIAKKGATAEVAEVLDERGTVGFVADQNAGKKGIFVDFFGRKASTYKSIGLLAIEYDCPVVVGYARRVNGRFQFVVGVQDIIHPADWRNAPDPLLYITQRYTKAIEDFVRQDPGQYWWVHRRWKTRPKGELPEEYD